ncbi:MAG: biotin--[Clostridia bacterium]|nr:biotin--[acetyl-CoA-carboxylase] ligase [Clostridia bacterium]
MKTEAKKKEKTKDVVLRELKRKRGKFVSGEYLANKLGISRAAIWKAVKTLQNRGFDIECRTKSGYMLTLGGGKLSEDGVKKYLFEDGISLTVLDSVGSTNDIAKALGREGAPEWTVVAAREQTGGRGRMGRTFESPADNGIYLSVLLRPKISPADSVAITTYAAVAVCDVIERFTGVRCEIKWVNDIYMKSKKVCGILTESSIDAEKGELEFAVLGIGINVSDKKLSSEVREIAGAIGLEHESDVKNKITAALLTKLKSIYGELMSDRIYGEYRSRSFLIGKDVTFLRGEETVSAKVVDLERDYSLVVETEDGERISLNSGEVSVKP